MSTSTLTIPAPVGYVDDRVWVLNYRRKPEQWELGTITRIAYTPAQERKDVRGGSFLVRSGWTYDVWIDRPVVTSKWGKTRGGGYIIQVRDESVRAV